MDAFSVGPVNPVAVGALTTLKPVLQPVAGSLAPIAPPATGTTLTIQELAQGLFQQKLQVALFSPVTEPAFGSAGLAQDAINSLLASMNPAQPTVGNNPLAAPAASPEVIQNLATPATTVPSSATPVTSPQDLPAAQDAFGTSLDPDFAMQTALRFGAGVTLQASESMALADNEGAGMVRDATAVLRLGNLQPRSGSPGPEAFTSPQAATSRVQPTSETASTRAPDKGVEPVDLLA